eukprot:6121931-Pyramimonas_sp.AAC.1
MVYNFVALFAPPVEQWKTACLENLPEDHLLMARCPFFEQPQYLGLFKCADDLQKLLVSTSDQAAADLSQQARLADDMLDERLQ